MKAAWIFQPPKLSKYLPHTVATEVLGTLKDPLCPVAYEIWPVHYVSFQCMHLFISLHALYLLRDSYLLCIHACDCEIWNVEQ